MAQHKEVGPETTARNVTHGGFSYWRANGPCLEHMPCTWIFGNMWMALEEAGKLVALVTGCLQHKHLWELGWLWDSQLASSLTFKAGRKGAWDTGWSLDSSASHISFLSDEQRNCRRKLSVNAFPSWERPWLDYQGCCEELSAIGLLSRFHLNRFKNIFFLKTVYI